MTQDLIFYAFAFLTVVSAFFVVFSRNIVHAGFSLLFTLFGVAGLYAFLGADFLAVTQIIVYVGGILVLILFTVMMTRIPKGSAPRRGLDVNVPAGIFALGLFALLYKVVTGAVWPQRIPAEPLPTTAGIGARFMTDYIFPFEYASLILLAAMIGAAIMIREFRREGDGGDGEPVATAGDGAGGAEAGPGEDAELVGAGSGGGEAGETAGKEQP